MGNTRASGPGVVQSCSVKQKHNLKQHPTSCFNEHSFPILLFILFLHFVPLLPYRDMWDQCCPRKTSWTDPEGKHNLHVSYKHSVTPAADTPEGHPGSGRRALHMRDVLRGGSANSPAAATAPSSSSSLVCAGPGHPSLCPEAKTRTSQVLLTFRKDGRWI